MSAPGGTRRLVFIRNEFFRYIKQSAQPRYGPGYYAMQWATCATKPAKPEPIHTVTNPGTTFARLQVVKPVFTAKVQFKKPCGLDNKDA